MKSGGKYLDNLVFQSDNGSYRVIFVLFCSVRNLNLYLCWFSLTFY